MRQARDFYQHTALTLASQFASETTVKILVEQFQFDINETGAFGGNCFLTAAQGGNDATLLYIGENYRVLESFGFMKNRVESQKIIFEELKFKVICFPNIFKN